jgi:hypothetical protein
VTVRQTPPHQPSPNDWPKVAALAIAALVVVVVVLVTRSAEAVAVVVTPLLLMLSWLTGERESPPTN